MRLPASSTLLPRCFERSRRLPVGYPKLNTQVRNFVSKSSISHLSAPNHVFYSTLYPPLATTPTHVLFHGTFAITWEVAMAYNLGVSGLEAARHNQSVKQKEWLFSTCFCPKHTRPSGSILAIDLSVSHPQIPFGIPNALPIPVFSPNLIGDINGVTFLVGLTAWEKINVCTKPLCFWLSPFGNSQQKSGFHYFLMCLWFEVVTFNGWREC